MLVNVSSVKKSEKGIEEDRWGQAAPVFSGRRGECEPGERKGWGGLLASSLHHTTGMGQQVGRVGESTSTGLQPPQPHASQPHQAKGNRGSAAGRRPREPGSSTGTPPGRTAAVNVPDPSINVFTLHSGNTENNICTLDGVLLFFFLL